MAKKKDDKPKYVWFRAEVVPPRQDLTLLPDGVYAPGRAAVASVVAGAPVWLTTPGDGFVFVDEPPEPEGGGVDGGVFLKALAIVRDDKSGADEIIRALDGRK